MALAVNDPQRLNEVFSRSAGVPSSQIRGGVVLGGKMGAFVKARQEAALGG